MPAAQEVRDSNDVTPCIVMKNDMVLYHQCLPFSSESMRFFFFAKVKEPQRGTRHNTRDELIRAIGRSVWNINKDGRADGARCLRNIWQHVLNKGGDYIEGT